MSATGLFRHWRIKWFSTSKAVEVQYLEAWPKSWILQQLHCQNDLQHLDKVLYLLFSCSSNLTHGFSSRVFLLWLHAFNLTLQDAQRTRNKLTCYQDVEIVKDNKY